MNTKKTTVTKVSNGRGWFWVGVVVLVACLSMFCSNAQAVLYEIDKWEDWDVSGIYWDSGDKVLMGSEFGYVKATAELGDNAYGIWNNFYSPFCVTSITDQFPSGGIISGRTLMGDNAYGLYCAYGSIYASDGINGTITADANGDNAYAMRSYESMVINGDIGSDANIAATARGGEAYGLYSENGSIKTGDIDGKISALVTGEGTPGSAYGIYADANLTTGAINGNITAEDTLGSGAYAMYAWQNLTVDGNISSTAYISGTAGQNMAYGLCSQWGDITVGDVNGIIDANAGKDRARGMWSWQSITTGNIDEDAQITAWAGDDYAAGLYSWDGSITTGDINGLITATAEDRDAYGLYSGGCGSIHTGDINGIITANANNGSWAASMYSDSNITTGDIGRDAQITAKAGQSWVYGLCSQNGSINTGDIYGTIDANAGEDRARGMWSWQSITTGNIDEDAQITATAGDDYAAGLYSSNGSITTGDINGVIIAKATNGSYAYGLYSGGGGNTTTTGDIGEDAKIIAKATNGSDAYGMYSYGTIDTNEINGKIIAKAENDAYGLNSANGYIYTDAINGKIIAKATDTDDAYGMKALYIEINGNIGEYARIIAIAERDNAYALDAWACHTYVGDIDGKIIAHAGRDNAYGMYDVLLIDTGTINGRISATADGNNACGLYVASDGWDGIVIDAINGQISAEATNGSDAYALFSASNINVGNIGEGALISARAGQDNAYGLYVDDFDSHYLITGDIDGTITATAGRNYAVGLYSDGTLTTGAIRGTIDANAGGDFAYGILSYDAMDVTIDGGTISAVADACATHVAAIQSGKFTSPMIVSQRVNDLVKITSGSTIVGDIDLAYSDACDVDNNDVMILSAGAGSTTFEDDIYNVEHIYITGGTWYFNGNVYNSAVDVSGGTGGTLSGNGTLNFDVNIDNGGVLAPGGSIGSMTIDGNLTVGSGGTYEVDVNNSGKADNVKVTGWADLDGTIRGNVLERIRDSFDVNVLDAAGGFDGTEFANAEGTTLFPIFTVSYDTDPCVILHVEMDYAYYADTDNQHSVGEAFNYIVENGLDITDDDMNDVLDAIEDLDEETINDAYNQIMPQDALGLADIIRNAMNQYSEGIFGRMSDIRNNRQYAMAGDSRYLLASAGAAALPPKTGEWMPFGKVFGSWGDRDAESDIAGYQYDIYGLAGGIDKMVSDNTLIGISVAGSRAGVDYSYSSTSSDIDSVFCSLYGSYFVDTWHIGVTLGYGRSWYDSKRGIPFMGLSAESDYQGNAYSAAVELGNNFGGTEMLLEPVVGLGYTAVQQDSYTEKGAGPLNLKVDSETTDGIYSKLGVRVAKEFRFEDKPNMRFVPNVSAFWIHDFADNVELDSTFIGGGSFTTEGLDPLQDIINIGAGLNVYYNNNLRLFVDYGWQSESSFNSHTIQAGAQWSF